MSAHVRKGQLFELHLLVPQSSSAGRYYGRYIDANIVSGRDRQIVSDLVGTFLETHHDDICTTSVKYSKRYWKSPCPGRLRREGGTSHIMSSIAIWTMLEFDPQIFHMMFLEYIWWSEGVLEDFGRHRKYRPSYGGSIARNFKHEISNSTQRGSITEIYRWV